MAPCPCPLPPALTKTLYIPLPVIAVNLTAMATYVHTSFCSAFPRAVLSTLPGSDPNVGLGILAAELDLSSGADGWCQLLPAGYFSTPDGRPADVAGGQWFLDGEQAGRLISQVRALKNDRLIDYEHQTLNAERNGQPAPAAGWWNAAEMAWRPGQGLYIRPRWTDQAREFIRNDQYRWLSAVFPYDRSTGIPLAIQMAGLVNFPGLDGLEHVSALKGLEPRAAEKSGKQNLNTHKEIAMDEWLKDLLTRLGIELSGDSAVTNEQGQAALGAVQALVEQAARADALGNEVAVLKAARPQESGQPAGVDLSQYVPKAVYDQAVVEIATLKGENSQQALEQLIGEALADGRAFAREQDYLQQFGRQQGLAALKTLLASRAPIAALTGRQTSGDKPPAAPSGNAALNDAEQAVLKATGISPEAFVKFRDGQ